MKLREASIKFLIAALILNSIIIAKASPLPSVSFSIPATAFVGEPVIVDGTTSSGVNGQSGWSTKTFANGSNPVIWNFGDGLGTYSTPKQFLKLSHVYLTAGTYNVSLTVKDSLGASSSVSHTIVISNIPAAAGGNLVSLINQGTNSANCSALQSAINTAFANNVSSEREITLPSITYTCQLTIPASSGDNYVTIRPTSASFLPAQTDRIDPVVHSANMPKIASPGVDQIPILMTAAANKKYLRILGIEFDKQAGHLYQFIEIGSGISTYAQMPHHIIIDRCYFKGNAFDDTARAIFVNADSFSLINSYLKNLHAIGADAQAIAGFSGSGIGIINNFLDGYGENILFGGADAGIKFQTTVSGAATSTGADLLSTSNLRVGDGISFLVSATRGPWSATIVRTIVGSHITFDQITNSSGVATAPDLTLNGVKYGASPQDIVIARNHLFKSLIYKITDPSYNGFYGPTVKNLFELKHAMRVIVDSNVLENHWGGQGQSGPSVLFTPRNQTCFTACTSQTNPWTMVRDVDFTNNIVKNVADFVNILGTDDLNTSGTGGSGPSAFVQYILVENNLVLTNASGMNGGGAMMFVFPTANNITLNHLTTVNSSGNGGYIIGSTATPFSSISNNVKVMNSIFKYLTYGAIGDGLMGNNFVNNFWPDGNITYNVISDDSGGHVANGDPWIAPKTAPNDFIANIDTNTFINRTLGNYKLKSTSPYKAGGASPALDGLDKGVDFDVVTASTANVVTGIWSGGITKCNWHTLSPCN